mgnify:CR=1 FL=1|jgi:hypothetical protein
MSKQTTKGPWHHNDGVKWMDTYGVKCASTRPAHLNYTRQEGMAVAVKYFFGNRTCTTFYVAQHEYLRDSEDVKVAYKNYLLK